MRWSAVIVMLLLVPSLAYGEIKIEVGPDGRMVFSNTQPSHRAPSLRRAVAPASIAPLVNASARRYRLDPKLVHAVIRAESAYNPRAVSAKGAIGLMQLMPATARELSVGDPFDPAANIDGGSNYLRRMLDRFNGSLELALAGYNAGPEAVRRFGGVPPYAETRRYVQRVLSDFHNNGSYRLPAVSTAAVGRRVYLTRDAQGRSILTTSTGR